MHREFLVRLSGWIWTGLVFCLAGCGGGGDNVGETESSRPFLMGSTPFFTRFDGSRIRFPDWRFENLEDRDLLSLHVDDFWGVPWDYCDATACSDLPPSWVGQWQQLVDQAKATGKPIYLSISPLGGRRTLAPTVLADGTTRSDWNTQVNSDGCYLFDSDANAAVYQAAYITFLNYLIERVEPDYLSPAIEMNMPFTLCPQQKAAWIAWYGAVHTAIKTAHPGLPVFPTFQPENLYGVAETSAACPGVTLAACFDSRLAEALTIPADRIAFSSYPAQWVYQEEFGHTWPRDTFAKTARATSRPIWVSETGWPAVPVLSAYAHGTDGGCGLALYPSMLEIPGAGTVDVANENGHAAYLAWLLEQAQRQGLEAVVWWLNRDYLDEAVTGDERCPCVPEGDSTCLLLDGFYNLGGANAEVLFRVFGNMALRRYDGTARPALTTWREYRDRPYRP